MNHLYQKGKQLFVVMSTIVLAILLSVSAPAISARAEGEQYEIQVNRGAACVTVYQYIPDETNSAGPAIKVPVRSFACSPGTGTRTPVRTTQTTEYYKWRFMGSCWTQYAVRFNGRVLFHSILFNRSNPGSLSPSSYNLLGEKASHGCVRLSVNDAKWIYDHCPKGTTVTVYDDPANPGPIGKPEMIDMNLGDPRRNWDPTDPDEANPWRSDWHSIESRNETGILTVARGQGPEHLVDDLVIKAADGTPLAPDQMRVQIQGYYNLNKVGRYTVWVTVWNLNTGIPVEKEFGLLVLDKKA